VTEKSEVLAATVIGAVIGGLAGYMFFTERGRTMRRQLEPAIDDLSRELASFRGTLNRAVGVANEGWQVLNEALGEGGQRGRYSVPRQTTPF
jgi:gas vesicle protein